MDVYYPPDETGDGRWPAVIIVAGYPGTMEPRATTLTYKEIGWTGSMCQLIALSGMVAIAYTNRDPVADLFDDSRTSRDILRQTLRFLRQHLTSERSDASATHE